MAGLTAAERQTVAQLAGILRLADAFDRDHDSRVRRLRVSADKNLITIEAEGYSARDRIAQALAGARYLLETFYRRPILVKTLREPKAMHKRALRNTAVRKNVASRLRAA
jgi:hypothetical protein